MRKENKNFESEVDKTLKSLDQWQRPSSNPYFFSKLQERIQADKQPVTVGIFTWLQPAFFALLIAFNLFTIYNFINQPGEENTDLSAYFEDMQLINSSEDYLSFDQE